MSKRAITTYVLLLLSVCTYAQRNIFGIIKNEAGRPIPSCLIQAGNNQYYSDNNGHFSLIHTGSAPLIIHNLAYHTKEVSVTADTLHITLSFKFNDLQEAKITGSKSTGKLKQAIMGSKKLKPHGVCTMHTGNEVAIFLSADSSRHGYLSHVYYYITDEGLPGAKFRVHVYDIDTSYLPGQDLVDSTVIIHGTAGNEWVSVDLSSLRIPVARGVFISMEWLEGYGNLPYPLTSRRYPAAGTFNGQILSFTEGYYKRGSLFYSRRNTNAEWQYRNLRGTLRRNTLNPMVYATYNYYW